MRPANPCLVCGEGHAEDHEYRMCEHNELWELIDRLNQEDE